MRVPVPKKVSARRQAPEHLLSPLSKFLSIDGTKFASMCIRDSVSIPDDKKITTSDVYMDVVQMNFPFLSNPQMKINRHIYGALRYNLFSKRF